jgi:CDP-2,3-bis-(O-geranylgeranyl)-sn-glycerol synthase
MHLTALLQILILLTVANATPVIAKRILGNRFAYPVDGNITLYDGRPLFGHRRRFGAVARARRDRGGRPAPA